MKEPDRRQNWIEDAKNIKDFDDILDLVGSNGKYQKLMLYGVLCPITVLFSFLAQQWIFMLSVPDHWCHVPGRPEGMNLLAWKNLTLPIEAGPDGHDRFSRCEMLALNGSTIKCEQWEYDTTHFEATIPSDFDWVCSDSDKVANVFSANSFGNTLGTVCFGMAADRFGRKRMYFIALTFYFLFYYTSLFIVGNFLPFIALKFLAGSTLKFMFSTPCLIAAELAGKDYRARIYSVVWMVQVLGNCVAPLIAYLASSWFTLGLVSAVPAVLLFLFYGVIEESPRWLVSVGRMDEAAKTIKKISKYNGTSVHPDLLEIALENIKKEDSAKKSLGVLSLFSKKRVAINTILLCICWTFSGLCFGVLGLNSTSMSGDPYLNFFYLSIIELPAGLVGGLFVGNFGRRWTQSLFFLICSIGFGVASVFVFYPELSWVVLVAAVCSKFCVSITFLVAYLQGTELFPTQLRATGSSFAATVASLFGIFDPYVAYLGQFNAAGPYLVLGLGSVIGSISSACLPETLNQKLPDTMEDAARFGKYQKFWSFLPQQREDAVEAMELSSKTSNEERQPNSDVKQK